MNSIAIYLKILIILLLPPNFLNLYSLSTFCFISRLLIYIDKDRSYFEIEKASVLILCFSYNLICKISFFLCSLNTKLFEL